MSSRWVVLFLAGLFLVAGVVVGYTSVSVGVDNCGSLFGDKKDLTFTDAIEGSDRQQKCASAINDKKPMAYGGLGLAAIALIATFVVPAAKPEVKPLT